MPDGMGDGGRVLQRGHELAADTLCVSHRLVGLLLGRAVAVVQDGVGVLETQADILQGLAYPAARGNVQQAHGRLWHGHGAFESSDANILGRAKHGAPLIGCRRIRHFGPHVDPQPLGDFFL
ncbi:hypothetical protein [Comamonas sp.]|uniref:hypothetical protein n=1 Tax=Comamonas sp. TaxID=34028 RepID=UPI00289FBF01|nr:hypothetical protein [Comamonas sp.]